MDDDTVLPDDVSLLTTFAEQPEVEVWRIAADAYPRFGIGETFDTPFPVGGALSIYTLRGGGWGAGVFGVYDTDRLRIQAEALAAETDVSLDDAFKALVMATASDEADADAFVTRHPFLLDADDARSAISVTPADGLAVVGLSMRVHGNEPIGGDLMDLRLKGRTFHFILARDLLRSGWRWFSGCVASGVATKDDSIVYLGQAAHERFQRVLQIRDRLHALAKLEPTRTRGDDLVFELETLLLFLVSDL